MLLARVAGPGAVIRPVEAPPVQHGFTIGHAALVLERIGRVGSFSWLLSPVDSRIAEHVADEVARAAAALSAEGHGALIVIERETGLEEVAETGVMVHGDLSTDLLRTIFSPRTARHDGAVFFRGFAPDSHRFESIIDQLAGDPLTYVGGVSPR